jgi:hypothetical protein
MSEQEYTVLSLGDADSPSEAWELLTANAEFNCEPSAVSWYLTCLDQQPSKIIATMEESAIKELPV